MSTGPKSSIAVFRQNLVIVSPPFLPSAGSKSATVRQYVTKNVTSNDAGNSATVPSEIAKVTIFDLQNKLISYSGTFRDGVHEVSHQWGGIFVFGPNGKLSRLDEHSTVAKLEVLYRRNLFTLAISLAHSQGVRESAIADIHRRYGDYLYGKGDFDGAMAQFVRTLGHLQPSYVIRNVRIFELTTPQAHKRSFLMPNAFTFSLPTSKNCTPAGWQTQITQLSCSTATQRLLTAPGSIPS